MHTQGFYQTQTMVFEFVGSLFKGSLSVRHVFNTLFWMSWKIKTMMQFLGGRPNLDDLLILVVRNYRRNWIRDLQVEKFILLQNNLEDEVSFDGDFLFRLWTRSQKLRLLRCGSKLKVYRKETFNKWQCSGENYISKFDLLKN